RHQRFDGRAPADELGPALPKAVGAFPSLGGIAREVVVDDGRAVAAGEREILAVSLEAKARVELARGISPVLPRSEDEDAGARRERELGTLPTRRIGGGIGEVEAAEIEVLEGAILDLDPVRRIAVLVEDRAAARLDLAQDDLARQRLASVNGSGEEACEHGHDGADGERAKRGRAARAGWGQRPA